jgi:sigma-E factor negative regulatory protein RseB
MKESALSMGATHTLTRQLGSFWLTAMGEVPMSTLKQFASALERKK